MRKAVLLEGSPGVGKTSLISALAAATGHEVCCLYHKKDSTNSKYLAFYYDICLLVGHALDVWDMLKMRISSSDPPPPLPLPNTFFSNFNHFSQLVRINLSEQTDVSDLFGSDLPVPDADSNGSSDANSEHTAHRDTPRAGGPDEDYGRLNPEKNPEPSQSKAGASSGGGGARFAWCDGVFLRALKAGKWVLLDELNLATQVR